PIPVERNNIMNTRPLPFAALMLIFGTSVAGADEPKLLEVSVAHPVAREISDFQIFTGRADAVESVEIRSRLTGYITKIAFKEGSMVKKGDLLFEIDSRIYQASADEAKAKVVLAETQLLFHKKNLERARAASGAVSKEEIN